jgi:hypothetical protein
MLGGGSWGGGGVAREREGREPPGGIKMAFSRDKYKESLHFTPESFITVKNMEPLEGGEEKRP